MNAKHVIHTRREKIEIVFLLLLGVVASFSLVKLNAPLIVALMAVQVFILIRQRKTNFDTTWYFWGLMALFFLSLIGLTYTQNLQRGFDLIGRQISFLLFPLFYTVYRVNDLSRLFKVYCVSIFALIVLFEAYTVYRFFYLSDTFPLSIDLFLSYRYTGGELTNLLEIHNAYFGMYVLFSNVLLLHYLMKVKGTRRFMALLFLVFVQSVFLLQMIAKTAIIINTFLIIFSVIYILIRQKKVKLMVFTMVLTIATVWVSYTYLKLPIERIGDRFTELNEGQTSQRETRIKLWDAALPIIRQNPIIGVGTGDVQDLLHASYRENGIEPKSNVHNQYLDYMMRYGSIGLLLFLGILGYALVHAVRTGNYIYFCFTLIIMGCCFTENILNRQWGITFYACFNYLLYLSSKRAM